MSSIELGQLFGREILPYPPLPFLGLKNPALIQIKTDHKFAQP